MVIFFSFFSFIHANIVKNYKRWKESVYISIIEVRKGVGSKHLEDENTYVKLWQTILYLLPPEKFPIPKFKFVDVLKCWIKMLERRTCSLPDRDIDTLQIKEESFFTVQLMTYLQLDQRKNSSTLIFILASSVILSKTCTFWK